VSGAFAACGSPRSWSIGCAEPGENDQERVNDREICDDSTSFCVRALKGVRTCRHNASQEVQVGRQKPVRGLFDELRSELQSVLRQLQSVTAPINTTNLAHNYRP